MSDFGIKPVGQVIAQDETETLEWQVKNLLPLVRHGVSDLRDNLDRAIEHELNSRYEDLNVLVFSRFVDNHKTYGNALFKMTDDDLQQALDEEIADAIVYMAEMKRRRGL